MYHEHSLHEMMMTNTHTKVIMYIHLFINLFQIMSKSYIQLFLMNSPECFIVIVIYFININKYIGQCAASAMEFYKYIFFLEFFQLLEQLNVLNPP